MRVKMTIVGIVAAFVISIGVMVGGGGNVYADSANSRGCSELLEFVLGAPPYDSEVGEFISANTQADPGRWAEILAAVRAQAC